MKRKILLIILLLFVISFVYIIIFGRTAKVEFEIGEYENLSINYNHSIIKCNSKIKNNKLKIKISSIKKEIPK